MHQYGTNYENYPEHRSITEENGNVFEDNDLECNVIDRLGMD
jgi:hypothetical protein